MQRSILFCFPYAGANAYAYRALAAHMPPAVTVSGIELPGRGRRASEPLMHSLEALADDAFDQLRSQLGGASYALFGHSMGAMLAYLCMQRIRAAGAPLPQIAILSGKRAPAVARQRMRHLLPHAEFKNMLTELGGCPPEILADDEFFAYFEQVLRADFQAVETWRYVPRPPLPVPLVVLRGCDDDVSRDEASGWAGETSATFEMLDFDGDHFFIEKHWPAIARAICARLAVKTET